MDIQRLFAPVLAFVILLGASLSAHAIEKETFSKERFDTLQAAGAPILVDVFASWCSTCAKQHEVLAAYEAKNPDSELVILQVDFDDQKEWVKYFKAPRQSTLVLFNGGEQVWFSVAETRREKIFTALDSLQGE